MKRVAQAVYLVLVLGLVDMGCGKEARFMKTSDGIIKDSVTGLQWLPDLGRNRTWDDAQAYVRGLKDGGFSDWRLPTGQELESLYDRSITEGYKIDPIFQLGFPVVWTGELDSNDSSSAWVYGFLFGFKPLVARSIKFTGRVLAVRSLMLGVQQSASDLKKTEMTDIQVRALMGNLVNLIGCLGAMVAFVMVIWWRRRAMQIPKQVSLAPDERRLGEMYGKPQSLTIRGLIAIGSLSEGKLVLTSKRLIYTSYNEKRHAFAITPSDLLSVEVREGGLLIEKPRLRISFSRGPKKKPTTLTWRVPERVTVAGNPIVFVSDKSWDNPNTAATFAALLEKWKAGTV